MRILVGGMGDDVHIAVSHLSSFFVAIHEGRGGELRKYS